MSTTLSARFAKLSKQSKPNAKRETKVMQRGFEQKNKRAAITQQRRGIVVSGNPKGLKKAVRVGKVAVGGRKPIGRIQNKKGKGPDKGKGKKAATPMDLDKDLDNSGKGPNPDLASLDRDMDDYFKKKPVAAEAE